VFTDPGGMPWHPQAVTRRFAVLGKNCSPKVERITLHGTRHSHAVTALRAGIDAKVVSERLGHASVSFTLDKYGSALPEHHEAAVDVFEAAASREAG
jgi:integrase